MLKKILTITMSLLLPISLLAVADELTLNQDAPKSYVVKKGDTLWDISGVFLNEPWLWPKLWRLNPEVNNPHLIYPGDELRLVFDDQGQPMLVKGKPELRWSPKNRITLKEQNPVSVIPLNEVAPYIRYDTILSMEEIESSPYVLGSDRAERTSLDGFKVYVNGDLEQGKGYAIYQLGEEIIDPETDDEVGHHLVLVGAGKAISQGNTADKEPATLYLEEVKQEVIPGAIVLPVNDGQLFPAHIVMQPAVEDLRGVIIESSTGLREFAKYQVVIINRGAEHDVKQGHVVLVKRKSPGIVETSEGPRYTKDASMWYRLGGEDTSDYNMPEEEVGQLLVFKVYEKVSLALIMTSSQPLKNLDIITAP